MTAKYCLCGCGEILTGRRTKFASDACRMRHNRQKDKANKKRSLSFALRSVSRQIEVELSVVVVLETLGGRQDLDDYYLNRPTMYVLALHIEDFLIEKYPDTRILAVKVDRVGRKW